VNSHCKAHVPDGGSNILVEPKIADFVLATSTNSPILCQIEAQGLIRICCVYDHEDWAVRRVARPVCGRILEGVAGIFGLIVDICSEGGNCLSLIWILVDGNNLLICQNLDGLIGCVAKIGSNEEVGLEKCPRCKVSLIESSAVYRSYNNVTLTFCSSYVKSPTGVPRPLLPTSSISISPCW
jgi:hypothetical protein